MTDPTADDANAKLLDAAQDAVIRILRVTPSSNRDSELYRELTTARSGLLAAIEELEALATDPTADGGQAANCTACDGSGQDDVDDDNERNAPECATCDGSGEVCPNCGGSILIVRSGGGRVSQKQCDEDGDGGCHWSGELVG